MRSYYQRGAFFVVLAVVPASGVFLGLDYWLRRVALGDSNLNQHAMLMAGLVNVGAWIVGATLLGYGLDCLLKGYRQSQRIRRHEED